MPDGPYSLLLERLKFILNVNGATTEEFERIADEVAATAVKVFRSPTAILEEGEGQALSDATDLMLIGAIVARYGMVMGNPFAGKE